MSNDVDREREMRAQATSESEMLADTVNSLIAALRELRDSGGLSYYHDFCELTRFQQDMLDMKQSVQMRLKGKS